MNQSELVTLTTQGEREKDSQIAHIPRINQGLNNKAIISCLPKVRLALPALRHPIGTLRQTLQEHLLNSTSLPQYIKLLGIVHRAAELEPFPNGPVILDVRSAICMRDIAEQGVVLLLDGGTRCRGCRPGRLIFMTNRIAEWSPLARVLAILEECEDDPTLGGSWLVFQAEGAVDSVAALADAACWTTGTFGGSFGGKGGGTGLDFPRVPSPTLSVLIVRALTFPIVCRLSSLPPTEITDGALLSLVSGG